MQWAFPGMNGIRRECPFRVFMKKRKGYIFTDKRHSDRAVMSLILGILSLVSLGIVIFLSGRNGGEAATGFGFTGVLAFLFSLAGEILGLITVQDKGYYRLFPVLGTVVNFFALVCVVLILYAGAIL